MTGIEIDSRKFTINKGINQLSLDLSDYSNGIYLVNINYEEKSKMLKLMVKH